MYRLSVAVVLALAMVAGGDIFFTASREQSPEYYSKYEMAPYEVFPGYEGKLYQKRLYPAAKWVTTKVRARSMDECQSVAFIRLFEYISGENSRGENIPMTVPVILDVDLKMEPGEQEYTMAFYLPREHQANPPAPTSPDLLITKMETKTVYSKRYPGYSTGDVCVEEYKTLAHLLKTDNVTFDNSKFIFAGYDSPFHFYNRRNEVWVIAGGK